MTTIHRQISIACPPAQVFAVLADVERLADFSHMTVEVKGPGHPLAVGDRFEQVVKVLHLELETEWEVTEVVPDAAIVSRAARRRTAPRA